jgi:hypothetical protein
MIDSGATGLFADQEFLRSSNLPSFPLKHPILLYNIDGSPNTAGSITHYTRLRLTLGSHSEWTDFLVTRLGNDHLILGLPWLRKVNPKVDWLQGHLEIPKKGVRSIVSVEEVEDEEFIISSARSTLPSDSPHILESIAPPDTSVIPPVIPPSEPNAPRFTPSTSEPDDDPKVSNPLHLKANRRLRRTWIKSGLLESTSDELWIAAGYTFSQQIAEQENRKKKTKSFEEMVPEAYRSFASVFSEEDSQRLPEHQPWDHAIELRPGAPETMRTKIYPMSPNEQEELNGFIEENLKKGYIRPSKSPISSPVFFIKKKDGKLRLVQDYRSSTNGLSRTATHFRSSPTSLDTSEELVTSPSLMSDGVTITSGLKKEMNGKPHSQPIQAFLNP